MRTVAALILLALLAAAGCGNKPPETKYDPDRKEHENHPQPQPDSVPQAGVKALKEIKQIRKDEAVNVKEDQKVVEESDTQ